MVTAKTSSTEADTTVAELVGTPKPAAYLLDYGGFGYGKFTLDPESLDLVCNKLHMLKERNARKAVYNTMFDMVKSEKFPGSRLLQVVKHNISKEKTEEVLSDVIRSIVPTVIGKYIPLDTYEKENSDMYEILFGILESKAFIASESTSQLLVRSVIGYASTDQQNENVFAWFNMMEGLHDVKFTKPDRHDMTRVIHESRKISQADKDATMIRLKTFDDSDKFELTQVYCRSAIPTAENKKTQWDFLMSPEAEKMSLYQSQEALSGFRNISQRDLLAQFSKTYFEVIGDIVSNKS